MVMTDIRELIKSNVLNDWQDILLDLIAPYAHSINDAILKNKNQKEKMLPEYDSIFKAFSFCSLRDMKVVIVGQDCYPTQGNAMGLCFSVPPGCKIPPSLRNVFKELERCGMMRTHGDLSDWAAQGVLLLNTALTVIQGKPGSHLGVWKGFFADVFNYISKNKINVVYMLWGAHARSYKNLVNTENDANLVLEHTHPSPLSRKPFVGCNHFVRCNEYLIKQNNIPIHWQDVPAISL